MKMTKKMTDAVANLHEAMKADYNRFMVGDDPIKNEMREEYADSLSYKAGSKYIAIKTGGGAHSFIVNTDTDKKFSYGDILKAASWKAPSRNFARGNIFVNEDLSNIAWTGA
jgi:hypothetical protein